MRAVRSFGTAVVGVGLGAYALNKPAFYSPHIFLADNVVVPILRCLDPETAHDWAVSLARFGPRDADLDDPIMGQRLWGMRFASPIGLAAGFDKDGRVVGGMLDLGFTFVEVGTVTPRAQQGNPQPRLFRLDADNAVINRYGFNSAGANSVCENIKNYRSRAHLYRHGLVGVNIGKNADSTDEKAAEDYATVIGKLGPQVDYLVVNLSSTGTPGRVALRSLLLCCLEARDTLHAERWGPTQANAFGELRSASSVYQSNLNEDNSKHIPLLLKISPDLTDQEKRDIAAVCLELHVDGIIAGNTTATRPAELSSPNKAESGGLSGEPLRNLSTQLVADMFYLTKGEIPIIGVGGVGSGADAFEKIAAGASLVQVYTMMSINGPGAVKVIKGELQRILSEKGFQNITAAVGSEHKRYMSSATLLY